ncbi:hypothetical protein HUU05_18405 [candidate division KSB1 bacterium]|nr:hypothetical protein [candidate division KSB1 bacterium]
MKRALLAVLGMAVSSLLLTACNKENPTGSEVNLDDQTAASLEKDFGGYTTSDEAPLFNDEDVLSESLEDVDANDAISADEIRMFNPGAGMKGYVLRITWGLLQGDSSAAEVVDWSGNASVNRGVLAVLRTINFEPGAGDRLTFPRQSRKELGFTSQTRPYLDGLLLMIIDKDTSATEGEFTLTLGTNYTRTFRFGELDSLDAVESVGANGHAVSIVSRSKEVREFSGGFLAGRWVRTNEQGGEFYGRWINSAGTNSGSLKGIWGVRRNGNQVFVGKYINSTGQFGGLLRGIWQFNGARNGGWFEGKWFDRALQETGTLQGHFRLGRPNDGKGFFHGRWEKYN